MTAVDVVVRCRNEMPHTRRTLEAIFAQQGLEPRVLFLDCGSTDGSREAAAGTAATVRPISPAEYVPGAVLNLGMRLTRSPLVAFVNADAVPLSRDALAALLAPLEQPSVAATYARQVARPDADALTRADYQRAFGDQPPVVQRGAFFSMAASAVRRDAWSALPFDEQLRFSEDADWTRRAAALGFRAVYLPEARFEHSHAYDLPAHLRRRAGEGAADTAIFRLGAPSVVGELVRPLAGALVRDLRAGIASPRTTLVRTTQVLGRFQGRREGVRAAACDGSRLNLRQTRRQRGFTLCGEPAAERGVGERIETARGLICAALGADLRTLALVGSYARGEGGAVATGGTLGPHNDLDLIAVVPRGAASGWRRKLKPLCAAWSAQLAIDVDVWAVDERFLEAIPPTLFWLDIALGGLRVLHGAELEVKVAPRSVPLDEAGRLLANRAVGLALSNLGGDETMARHAHKAVLACGDALLLAANRYPPTLRERLTELERLSSAPAVGPLLVGRYAEALRYRARPDLFRPSRPLHEWYAAVREDLARWHFAFESFRCDAPASPTAFACWTGRLYETLPDVRPGGALVASLRAAAAGAAPLFPYLGHPRERLARAAVALAYGPGDLRARSAACRLLGVRASASDTVLVESLRALAARAG